MEWHERFDAKWMPEPMSGCWLWFGAQISEGYGQLVVDGKRAGAHRLAHERWVGPIPCGFVIDHLCRNPSCVNPEHLEAVTTRENLLRGVGPSAQNAVKTHCLRGHELAGANIRETKKGRICRECERSYIRAWARMYPERVSATARASRERLAARRKEQG
jgi:HNH endonuclease